MKQIYTYIGAGLVALSFTNLIACTEIEHGVNDIDTWEEVKDYTEALNHPCMLHTGWQRGRATELLDVSVSVLPIV